MNKENLIYLLLIPAMLLTVFFIARKPSGTKDSREENQQENVQIQEEQKNTKPNNQVNNITQGENKMEKPEMIIDQNKSYTAVMQTSKGNIKLKLNVNDTPKTVNNFVYLARNNFYDNTIFHRVIKGFMIQGGDPNGDGTGGPGYKFDDEPFEGEYTRGTLAMANSGPNTNGSQFFIMHQDYDLPPNYVIFGEVVEGLDVVDAIANIEVKQSRMGEMSVPVEPVELKSVEIIEE